MNGPLGMRGLGGLRASTFRPGVDGTWVDFNFGVGALTRGSAAPNLISLGATSIEVLGFDGVNTLEQVSASIEMDHNWKEGSIVKPHLHWLPATAAAGSVKWQLEWVVVDDDSTLGASATLAVLQAAPGVAWQMQRADFADINLAGYDIGTQFFLRLFRDPTDGDDDYGADAALATFGLHVQVDTLGSRQVGIK